MWREWLYDIKVVPEIGRKEEGRNQGRGREKKHRDSEVQAVMRMLPVHRKDHSPCPGLG